VEKAFCFGVEAFDFWLSFMCPWYSMKKFSHLSKEAMFAADRNSFYSRRFSSFRAAAWAVACPHA